MPRFRSSRYRFVTLHAIRTLVSRWPQPLCVSSSSMVGSTTATSGISGSSDAGATLHERHGVSRLRIPPIRLKRIPLATLSRVYRVWRLRGWGGPRCVPEGVFCRGRRAHDARASCAADITILPLPTAADDTARAPQRAERLDSWLWVWEWE